MKAALELNKSIISKIIIGCLWVPFFISCSSPQKESVASEVEDVTVDNPNEDSELTLLMRKMYDQADSIKATIKAGTGNITKEFIDELEFVHEAIPSDPKLSNPTFTAFNELIITEAKTLRATKEKREVGFNNLVNRCIECHKTFCPGPIPRIKKLKI